MPAASAPAVSIVASVPGRLRLRDTRWRRADLAHAAAASLQALTAATATRVNAAAASIVLQYDRHQVDEATMRARALALLLEPGEAPAPTPAVPPAVPVLRRESTRRPVSRRRRMHQAVKMGMLLSLGSSLALAAMRARRAHVLTGTAFVGLLGAHLVLYRRTLLR